MRLLGPAVRTIAVAAAALGVTLVAACDDRRGYYHDRVDYDCEETTRQCRTTCDYWCDGWGCYPTCWDQCWDECSSRVRRPYPSTSSSGEPTTSSSGNVIVPVDAGIEPSGTGVLCTSCSANSECESGAVCILRGGAPRTDASASDGGAPPGRGFCGHACASSNDCPDGFVCSQLGSSRQCLPTAGSCE